MDRDYVVEIGEGIVFDWNNGAIVAGIVDQNIDVAEPFAGGRYETGAVRFSGQVRGDESGLATLIDFPRDLFQFRGSARGEKNRSALGCEQPGNGATDSPT